jgi:hypothetical protein
MDLDENKKIKDPQYILLLNKYSMVMVINFGNITLIQVLCHINMVIKFNHYVIFPKQQW